MRLERTRLGLALAAALLAAPLQAGTIYVVPGGEAPQFIAAQGGIRDVLGNRAAVWIQPGGRLPAGLGGDDVVLAVGARAAREAIDFGATSLVGCMLVDSRSLAGLRNSTMIGLVIPARAAVEHLRRVLPETRRVAVVHGERSLDEARELLGALGAEGIRGRLVPLASPADLASDVALNLRDADAVMVTTDPLLLSSQAAHSLLLAAMRAKVPVAGLSEAWVRAGALYALERDYEEVGRQCAQSALLLARGEAAPAPAASRIRYTLNRRTAIRLGIDFPPPAVRGAMRILE